GIDLYDLLEKCGRLPYDVAAIIAMQVARALDYVHYRGIVHRDIKPANVMISRQGGIKVMDFGIARDTSFGELTEGGTGSGTPAYMSPEQVLGDKLDARSDIFSLGVMLYQMVTGKKPFVEDERRSAMHKIRLEKHLGARKLNPEIPRELERVIDRCLEKKPRDRWRSAQHMVIALERLLAKHVEMNHHARLVLFIRSQNVITELEAEEYLNPAALGAGGSAQQQPNMQARHVVRGGIVAHVITLGVLMLMLGLIHVAPLGATPATPVAKAPGRGFLRVNALPWANVAIDGRPYGATPMARPIELKQGSHVVRFEHDWYQPVERTVEIAEGAATAPKVLSLDFEAEGIPAAPGKTRPAGAPAAGARRGGTAARARRGAPRGEDRRGGRTEDRCGDRAVDQCAACAARRARRARTSPGRTRAGLARRHHRPPGPPGRYARASRRGVLRRSHQGRVHHGRE